MRQPLAVSIAKVVKMATRQTKWTTIKEPMQFLTSYIGEDYKFAFVRILTKYLNVSTFNQYFQISYTTETNVKKFQSFKIYNDDEEKLIKQNIPGIAEYVTTATF